MGLLHLAPTLVTAIVRVPERPAKGQAHGD
jgi:hypothetical protein